MLSYLSCPYCHNTFEYEFCICTRKNSQSKHSIEYIQCTLLLLDNLEYKYRNRRWKLYGHKPRSYLRTKCKGNLGVQKYKPTLPAAEYNPLKCAERNISKTLTHQTTGRTRVTTGTCFIQKIYAPSSSLLQSICLFPFPHFASIFFAYLCSFHWTNCIVTLPRYFSFRLPHLNISTGNQIIKLHWSLCRILRIILEFTS